VIDIIPLEINIPSLKDMFHSQHINVLNRMLLPVDLSVNSFIRSLWYRSTAAISTDTERTPVVPTSGDHY
jgi:hypothetical protein